MIAAIIQARMGSTRLASKTLADIAGVPLLGRVIERTLAIPGVDTVVVATTAEAEDRALVDYATSLGVGTFQGSADDVLSRYAGAARQVKASAIVRITADDPFKDPEVCGRVLLDYLSMEGRIDYVSNTITPTYPEGLDVEVFSREALERADREAALKSEREHVTPYIYNHPDRFRIRQVLNDRDLSTHRWTLDYAEDLAFTRAVYTRLISKGLFLMNDILTLLEQEPALQELNQGFTRNAGYLKSLETDRQ